jgi:hypothetical protein
MKFIETEQIAEISFSNNRYCKGWSFYVINGDGDRMSYLETNARGFVVPAEITRFTTKAEALAELKKQFPAALLLKKDAFRDEWDNRLYRGDNS